MWPDLIGLKRIYPDYRSLLWGNAIISHLLLLIVLELQAKIFERKQYEIVLEILEQEQKDATIQVQKYIENKMQTEKAKKEEFEVEKQIRWKRLEDSIM